METSDNTAESFRCFLNVNMKRHFLRFNYTDLQKVIASDY